MKDVFLEILGAIFEKFNYFENEPKRNNENNVLKYLNFMKTNYLFLQNSIIRAAKGCLH